MPTLYKTIDTAKIEAVFWDWDGTLCSQKYFWNKSAPHDPELQKLQAIWQRPQGAADWMRGQETLEELRQQVDCKHTYDQLSELMQSDWKDTSAINTAFFSGVKSLIPGAAHYIATDNMDIFTDYVNNNLWFSENITAVFNSFDFKCLKDDEPSLFDKILAVLGRQSFQNALLFDNDATNCEKFEALGGRSILITRSQT